MFPRSSARLTAYALPKPFFIARNSLVASQFRRTTTSASAFTQIVSPDDAHSILVARRKQRPISPHLSIYQPQLTWYGSAANRITGSVLSVGAYGFFAAYAVAPAFGWHFDSATIAAAFSGLPVAAKFGIKFAVALPFSYHSWNGIRHLLWDTGKALDIRDVYRTGYAVLGLTAISTICLAMV
ncbi:cytochrome b560 subunit of succinate dehydrogenase [Tuber magnatum]|uniref:Cytochrome b560 subunit of succinate dehydrogenase n=1 Tax=Tuber magnatum TaxID=42249 RepID=A0A317SF35_9PEZI|nr:cytochrome b560 subunit of succinate dehydrogenase [Tuber magnatum]